jgi:cell volume regulation protein A
VSELISFGEAIAVVAGGLAASVLAYRYAERIRIPAPGLLLVAAAGLSDVFPELGRHLGTRTVERVAVVALVVILFEGGMRVGHRRFREALAPIISLGVIGTLATAVLMTAVARLVLCFSWSTSAVIGAALAPTDPAVMFSVFRRREVAGRSATILEGEAGANDPVSIAMTIAAGEVAAGNSASVTHAGLDVVTELALGAAIGVGGGLLLLGALRRVTLPEASFYPLWALALAALVYGVAATAHGSGFLAAYVAGVVVGDAEIPRRSVIVEFQRSLAGLGEIVVLVILGLTVNLASLGRDWLWLEGIALASVLVFVARPLVVTALLLPMRLSVGERAFIAWSGLKGAVPILLASFALLEHVEHADRIYGLVFVVVAVSVLVQGTTVPFAASRLGVPLRPVAEG